MNLRMQYINDRNTFLFESLMVIRQIYPHVKLLEKQYVFQPAAVNRMCISDAIVC